MKKGLITIISVGLIWEFLVHQSIIDRSFFPAPHSILQNTYLLFTQDNLLNEILHSLGRLGLSFLITFPFSIILALLTSHWKPLDDFINPLIAFSFPLPKVAIYPLLLLIFGIASSSKIALISIGIFYLMYINFRIGFLRLLSSQFFEIAKIYQFKGYNYFWNFLIRGSQQEIYTGLKLALNYGLTLVVVSEISISNNGIGHFIWRSWDQFKISNVYSGVLCLSVIGFVFYYSFNYLIDRARKLYF